MKKVTYGAHFRDEETRAERISKLPKTKVRKRYRRWQCGSKPESSLLLAAHYPSLHPGSPRHLFIQNSCSKSSPNSFQMCFVLFYLYPKPMGTSARSHYSYVALNVAAVHLPMLKYSTWIWQSEISQSHPLLKHFPCKRDRVDFASVRATVGDQCHSKQLLLHSALIVIPSWTR